MAAASPTHASLLDHVDLPALRAAAAGLGPPFGVLAACLVAGGALAHDPDEPDWADRDRLVPGDTAAAAALSAALLAAGHPGGVDPLPAHEAAPFAAGLAAASRLDGAIFRTWCVLGRDGLAHGATWEAARTGREAGLRTLTALVAADAEACADARAVFGAAGWRVATCRGDDPAEVLAALDHALAADRPSLVTARA